MQIRYFDQKELLGDFKSLVIELECGDHYDKTNQQHVEWLPQRVAALYALGARAICLYSDSVTPVGFILVIHDPGLQGVRCFGKKASIAMFGLNREFRSKGMGAALLRAAEDYAAHSGAECLYVDTYAANAGAIRYYTREGFIPMGYYPGVNGLDDKGQGYRMIFCPVKYTQDSLCLTTNVLSDANTACVSQVGHKLVKSNKRMKYKEL